VNRTPSTIVSASPVSIPLRSPSRSAWCAQVTVQPDSNRMSVFMNGTSKAGSTSTPCGGQTAGSALGNRLELK
jgi:hypothetical protein